MSAFEIIGTSTAYDNGEPVVIAEVYVPAEELERFRALLGAVEDAEYVYRAVRKDGGPCWTGRRSDPFTRAASARARATQEGGKVQRSAVVWEDYS
jgi:PAS domain-containing protein